MSDHTPSAIPHLPRCTWCGTDPLYVAYHDEEWGVPSHDDVHLFEMLTLEGAQAGLSWLTILRKRANYRRAFHDFDIDRIAQYTDADVLRLMADAGIVRNRMKIEATIRNARAAQAIIRETGSLGAFLWDLAGGAPVRNHPGTLADIATHTEASDRMSRALKRRGFTFVGTTICHAFMQAVGMVDDHMAGCWRRSATPLFHEPPRDTAS